VSLLEVSDLEAGYGLEPAAPGRPLQEISRPFWKISPEGAAGK